MGIGWRLTKIFTNSVWNGQNRFNIVFHTQPITIASFDPLSQSINFLTVPDNTYIDPADVAEIENDGDEDD